MCAKPKDSSRAEEEALKTAKSSATAANKYAIFLLSCLSGCQSLPVPSLGSLVPLPFPHPAKRNQTKKSNKARVAYQCNLVSVYFFVHIPFD